MKPDATSGEPATPAPDQIGELEPSQELVLAALLAGKPYREVTSAGGVSRTTVWRWLTGDPRFIARYNAGRRELVEQAQSELLTLASSAVGVIRRTLEKGTGDGGYKNFLAAVKVLELLGCGGPAPAGSIDPAEVAGEIEKAEIDRRHQAHLNQVFRALTGDRPKDRTDAEARDILLKALGG
jgi:hypothetical protein